MAKISDSITGTVTSWAGGWHSEIVDTNGSPIEFSLNVTEDSIDSTPLNPTSGYATMVRGMRSWSGTMTIQLEAPAIGNLGTILYVGPSNNGYDDHVTSWEINWNCAALEDTVFGATDTADYWKSFAPGLVTWGGSYTCFPDDATLAVMPIGTPAAASFFISDQASGTDDKYEGNISLRTLSQQVTPTGQPIITYGFDGTGVLQVESDTSTSNFFDATTAETIARPTTGSLIMIDNVSGNRYTGDAFATSLAWRCSPQTLTTLTVGFQGTGDLTPDAAS